jgi:uncharacterized protein DUF6498
LKNKIRPRISFFILLLVNLLPVLGVFLFNWNVFIIIFLYWLENVITGFYNVLRMLTLGPYNVIHWVGKIFTATFFTFHYGMFTAVHGIFVITLFGRETVKDLGNIDPAIIFSIITKYKLVYVVLALFLSHGISFLINYIGSGEYQRTNLKTLMMRPYTRIIVLHLVVLAGGFFVMALKSPQIGIILLVFLKTTFDLKSHKKEHGKDKKQLTG